MKLEIAEEHLIVVKTPHCDHRLKLLLLKKSNPRRPTYRIAVAFETPEQPKIHYLFGYMEHVFSFYWTEEQSRARCYSEQQAKNIIKTITDKSDMFETMSGYHFASF
jgi:hypothetical protein